MANKYMTKCSTFSTLKVIQIKMTLRFYLNPVRMSTIKKQTTDSGEDAGRIKNSHTVLVGM
jgi:hypothetical protein